MKQEVIDRIAELEAANSFLTPDIVVADAMNPDSPLHGEFTWDKNKAASLHWLAQARKLIASVKIVITVDSKTIKTVAYVRDPSRAGDEQGYLSVERVKNEKDTAREVLIEEFNRAGSALKRARRLAAVFNIEDQVEGMAKDVNRLSKFISEQVLHS